MAIASGVAPTVIGGPARRVAMSTGVTVPEPALATNAVRPFGVTTIACGSAPTLIGLPARLVIMSMGVTVPEPEFTTNAVGGWLRDRDRWTGARDTARGGAVAGGAAAG